MSKDPIKSMTNEQLLVQYRAFVEAVAGDRLMAVVMARPPHSNVEMALREVERELKTRLNITGAQVELLT